MIFGAKILLYLFFAARLSLIDLRNFRLPHRLTLPMAGLGFLFSLVPGNGLSPWESLLGFIAGVVPLGILAYWWRNSFGFGDAMFAGAIGAFSGAVGVGIALVCGGLIALAVFKIRKEQGLVAFGPWLAIGGLAGILLTWFVRNGGAVLWQVGRGRVH
jgi:leader peptidase (prepilin peptidase)/N-methyltransferase